MSPPSNTSQAGKVGAFVGLAVGAVEGLAVGAVEGLAVGAVVDEGELVTVVSVSVPVKPLTHVTPLRATKA